MNSNRKTAAEYPGKRRAAAAEWAPKRPTMMVGIAQLRQVAVTTSEGSIPAAPITCSKTGRALIHCSKPGRAQAFRGTPLMTSCKQA